MNAHAYETLVTDGQRSGRATQPEEHGRGCRVSGAPPVRLLWIDGLRGLAIVAMLVSHVGLVTGSTPAVFHLVLMRPFAPLFLLVFGFMYRPGWRRRHWQLVATALAAQVMAIDLGFAVPNIIPLILLAVLVMPLVDRWPQLVVFASVTQLVFWPMPDWWTGYPVGFVILCAMAGRHLPLDGPLQRIGDLAARAGLHWVGRYPVRWYLGHLLVLVVAVRWFA